MMSHDVRAEYRVQGYSLRPLWDELDVSAKKTKIMFIEDKSGNLEGQARIGRVTFSKSGLTLYYRGRCFIRIQGFKSNYMDEETGAEFWFSGPKRRGGDRLYGVGRVEIDEDVREDYWIFIRKCPENITRTFYRD